MFTHTVPCLPLRCIILPERFALEHMFPVYLSFCFVSVAVMGFGLLYGLSGEAHLPVSASLCWSAGLTGESRHLSSEIPAYTLWPLHPRPRSLYSPCPCLTPLSSGSLKPCLYCQRACWHLPPLEHLVLCWLPTENSTIESLMNCYFWTRDKHTAL